jgi:hypothetical protein
MGNPPYNSGSTGNEGEKKIDDDFINKSLSLLKDKTGLLLFVTKTGWRSLNSNVYKNIIDKQIIYIKTYDFTNKPFKENVLPNYFLIKNSPSTDKTTFEYLNKKTKSKIIKGMNIYFLYKPYLYYLNYLKNKFGNLDKITRSKKEEGNNYLLIRHGTYEVLLENEVPKNDKYYIISNPNKLMKYFFKDSNLFKDLREVGRFAGFSTPKDLFYDIPNFNNIKNMEEQNIIFKKLEKFNEQLEGKIIKGGKINTTIKIKHNKKTVKKYINIKLKNKKTKRNSKSKGGKKNKTIKYRK